LTFYHIFIIFLILFFYHFISRHEEKLLVEKFDKDYEEYIQDVPMWIPLKPYPGFESLFDNSINN